MCGIVGVYGKGANRWSDHMNAALKKIHHRGPDDLGTYVTSDIALGQTRLSIVDVSGGKQPIFSEDNRACIICNGEIYNHLTIREKLPSHHFRTRSDTEVILHLFEEEGKKVVSHLDGMFAFIVYDGNSILVARDPLGIKPLYLGVEDGHILFASEIKALQGLVRNIQEFPAGHYFTPENGLVRYYQMKESLEWKNNVAEICTGLREHLGRAIEKRWMGDVPVGCFLSGGIDSSLISAVSKRNFDHLDTFSVGLGEEAPDLPFARKVAQFLGTSHHEYIYTPQEVLEALPDIIYHLESFDPALVRSAIPCYFVSKLASQHVKVILTGEGSDEVFAGYHYFKQYSNREDVHEESLRILYGLHNMNLQRVDRATMAYSIEGRVPFLDIDFIEYAFSIDPELKKAGRGIRPGKWLLRQAFNYYLPKEVIWRPKMEFAAGCGSEHLITQLVDDEITDEEFEHDKDTLSKVSLTSKEELYYYRIFHDFFGTDVDAEAMGRWQGGFSAEFADL
jgi:asparagine synthase (glutamine-hydrolysing)